jgi:hypothetical protein
MEVMCYDNVEWQGGSHNKGQRLHRIRSDGLGEAGRMSRDIAEILELDASPKTARFELSTCCAPKTSKCAIHSTTTYTDSQGAPNDIALASDMTRSIAAILETFRTTFDRPSILLHNHSSIATSMSLPDTRRSSAIAHMALKLK